MVAGLVGVLVVRGIAVVCVDDGVGDTVVVLVFSVAEGVGEGSVGEAREGFETMVRIAESSFRRMVLRFRRAATRSESSGERGSDGLLKLFEMFWGGGCGAASEVGVDWVEVVEVVGIIVVGIEEAEGRGGLIGLCDWVGENKGAADDEAEVDCCWLKVWLTGED